MPLYAEEDADDDGDKSSDTSITVRLRVLDDTIASRLNGNMLDEFSKGKNTRAERSILFIAKLVSALCAYRFEQSTPCI